MRRYTLRSGEALSKQRFREADLVGLVDELGREVQVVKDRDGLVPRVVSREEYDALPLEVNTPPLFE